MSRAENPSNPNAVSTKREFGRALTNVRESAGFTVRDLARSVDVPFGTISGWCTGRHLPTLSQKDLFLRLLTTCGVTEEDLVEEWLACWLRLRRPLGHQRLDAPTPYRGLEAFQPEHADWFFGRSRLTEALVHRITSGAPGMTFAVGPSGSGKSSLLRAGVVPALCGNGRSDRWQGLSLVPGARPLSTLAAQLSMLTDLAPDVIEGELRDRPAQAARRMRRLVADQVLVVVDQFEEVFTAGRADVAEQGAFLDALHSLAEPGKGGLRVVAGMRADFYPDALRWPVLAAALQDNQVTIGPMTETELRQAIVEPARLAGIEIEPGLVDLLLRDVTPAGARHGQTDTGSLPLLSHALLATWEQGRHRTMSIADYAATGGIHGAVARTAEIVFTGLAESDQDLARQLFLRLVSVGDKTPNTRRRVSLEELTGGSDDRTARTRELLGRYVDRRLITADVDGVQISHEALLDSWPRLREWIDANRSGLRLHQRLTESAKGWQDAGRDAGALYRGVRLDAAVEWVTHQNHRDDLNQLEQDFLDASVQANRAERLLDRRRTRRLRWLVSALTVLLVLSAAATAYSLHQQAVAERERNLAISRQVAGTATRLAESDPALAAQLAVAAYRIAPTVEATSSLLAATGRPTVTRMVRPGGALQAAAVNPAGTLLAAAGADESDTAVLLWDLRDPRRPALLDSRLTGHGDAIYAAAFSPDGATLATGSADHTVRLWDVTDPAHPRQLGQPLTGPADEVLSVEFSPDGKTLAAGGRDRTIRLWNVSDREHPAAAGPALTGATGAVQSIAFHPGGTVMAVADAGGAVRVWDTGDQRQPRPLGTPWTGPSRVNAVAFSPDGKTLAAGSNDSSVRLWTMTDPSSPVPAGMLTGTTGWINAITFSADGTLLAAANASARVQLWDLTTRQVRLDLPHSEPATAVAFRDGDRALYTNSADGVARRWLVPGPVLPTRGRQITGLAFHPDRPLLIDGGIDTRLWDLEDRDRAVPVGTPLTAPPDSDRMTGNIALSPDGEVLAAAARSGNTVVLWDITRADAPRLEPVRLTGHTALLEHVQFSHKGRLLASASDDGTVRLWDTTGPHPLSTLDADTGIVYASAFSPSDDVLAAVTENGYVALWDVRNPREPAPLGRPIKVAPDDARSLAISPDGRTLAVGIANGTVLMWDMGNPRAPQPIGDATAGPDGFVHALTFSPDGTVLAGGAGTGQTWMWRVTGERHLAPVAILQASPTTTWALQFSPDGRQLAAAAGDVHLWETDPDRAISHVCQHAGDRLSDAEWAKNIPDTPYRSVCS
ncbi:nSTAND1 domain-containing NTPase [Lentzea terrae]|uniref:nSTAND1 domain-containing NTPase n=1 Tax=Lentzea terrae TaxID=2200761 RepID=UPI0013008A4F|nr:helix-turn-helix domain-containing protein [Lentzea terrae]